MYPDENYLEPNEGIKEFETEETEEASKDGEKEEPLPILGFLLCICRLQKLDTALVLCVLPCLDRFYYDRCTVLCNVPWVEIN